MSADVSQIAFTSEVRDHLAHYFSDTKLDQILRALAIPPALTTVRFNPVKVDSSAALALLENYLEEVVGYIDRISACLYCLLGLAIQISWFGTIRSCGNRFQNS